MRRSPFPLEKIGKTLSGMQMKEFCKILLRILKRGLVKNVSRESGFLILGAGQAFVLCVFSNGTFRVSVP